ncbi:hypothetical protein ACFL1M_04240 [Patescibacteria group bacterium]
MVKKINKFISSLLLFILFLWPLRLMLISQVEAAYGVAEFEQQINISNGEFSTTNGTDSPTDNSLGLITFNSADYDGDTVYFEAVIKCDTCSGGNNRVTASLYSDSGSSATTVNTSNSTYTRVRSGSLAISADDYTVRFQRDATAGTAYIKSARLIIVQSNASGVTDTQTHIEVGHYENTTNTSATEITAPKHYVYDDDKFTGTKNAYFEATLKTTSSSTQATYYFNGYDSGTEEWSTNPSFMTDNNTANYASTSTDTDVHLLNSNTNGGSDLGTITAVEIRAYSYQDTGSTGTVDLRPVFSGGDGDNHNYTPPNGSGSAAWSSYFDITTDTNAPSSWSWTDVQNLDNDVVWNSGGGGNTGYISKVEVRVTYEDNTIIAYAQLYNTTNSTVVSTINSSSESYERVRSSALSTNWDTTNDDQYVVRTYTSNGSNAAYISNAKIVIDQTDSGGIEKLELAHQYINTTRTQTNTAYTQDAFTNQFDPANYTAPHTFNAYFESTIKTSGGTGYAMLYNVSDTDTIDTPTTSELTTTSTSFERKVSANLAANSDWPSIAKSMDTVAKATSSQTTTITSSRLLIEIANIDPAFQLTIEGESIGQTHNGITTTISTDITTLPFGNLDVGEPEYGAHKLTVAVNDANVSYIVQARLLGQFQGVYPANHIDPYIGNSATWTSPQLWAEPTGTTKNVETGWFGANTTDTDVTGWGSGTNKFGPISTDNVTVMSSSGTNETEYVTYAIEVNGNQAADLYNGSLIYTATPTY